MLSTVLICPSASVRYTIDALLSIRVCGSIAPSMATVHQNLTKRTCSAESTSIPTKTHRFRRIAAAVTTPNIVAAHSRAMDSINRYQWRCSVEFCGRGSKFDHFRARKICSSDCPPIVPRELDQMVSAT